MRKSTLVVLLLLLGAGAGLLFLADAYLGPLKEGAEVGQRLSRLFGDGGDLAPGSRVKTRRLPGAAGLEGAGLRIEATPAPAVLARRGGLRALARALAREGGADLGGFRWVRIRLLLPEGGELDVLVPRGADGQVGEPDPALPERWPPGAAPPAGGAAPSPAPRAGEPGGGAPGPPGEPAPPSR